jgi:hypothetical protein
MQAKVSYLDLMLSENGDLTDNQLMMLVWEALIESTDTTLATTEWAMYELAKNPEIQASFLLFDGDIYCSLAGTKTLNKTYPWHARIDSIRRSNRCAVTRRSPRMTFVGCPT